MNISFDFLSVIMLIGFINGLILIFALFSTVRGNRKANRILSFYFLCYTIYISAGILLSTKLFLHLPNLIYFWYLIQLLYGPLLFFYRRALYYPDLNLEKKDLFHFVPFCLSLLYFTLIKNILGYNHKVEHITMTIFFLIQALIYIIYFIMFLKKMHETRIERYSIGDRYNFSLLFTVTGSFIILFLSNLLVLFLFASGFNYSIAYRITPVIISLLFYFFEYKTLKQPEIILHTTAENYKHYKNNKNGITDNQLKDYINRLYNIMETEKPYTDPDLTLPMLANRLSIHRNKLSFIINKYTGSNFHNFVNRFRIEEVKTLLKDPSKQDNNILNIAYDAGFNSKSTFNTIFKKYMKMSPSEFKKKQSKPLTKTISINLPDMILFNQLKEKVK